MIKKIIDKIIYRFNYIIANTIMKKKIDNENNVFDIMDDILMVDEIINNNKSLARFGDGELRLILNETFNISFQSNSKKLKQKLEETLNSNLENLIIGINASFNDSSIYNKKTQKYWRTFNYLYRNDYKKIIPLNKKYGNSSITRFYIDYDNKDITKTYERLNNIKRIWNNRKLLIVEGKYSKLGVGNDLFSNSKQIRRIIVPEKNAFDKYEEIILAIEKNRKKDELVLLAAGPTATILAFELAKKNIQSVDVGHIDIEYEWMKLKTNKRVVIKGKYVNEIKGKKYTEENSIDKKYNNSIITTIY